MNIEGSYAWSSTGVNRENSPLLPKNIRGLIIGKSNCGKTTLILNLLLRDGWLDFTHLMVFGNSLHQQEYQILKKGFQMRLDKKQISNLFSNQEVLKKAHLSPLKVLDDYTGECNGKIKAEFYNDCTQLPDPAELNSNEKHCLLLDDCFLGKQNKAESYYSRGRHSNCDTFYISQSYFRLPRHSIRENGNFIILFPQDSKNLNHLYADHCEGDMSIDEFKQFCRKVWNSGKHNFVTLDLTSTHLSGKYRKNLDSFYFPANIKQSTD